MILGLRTVVYSVSDLAAGKAWYSKVLEKPPYFDEPFYVGFEVGGFELGLIPDGKTSLDGPLAYWGVEDAAAEIKRLESLSAKVIDPAHEVGGGIYVASIADPFGNSSASFKILISHATKSVSRIWRRVGAATIWRREGPSDS